MNEPYKIARQRLYLGRGCLVSVSVSGQWEGCTSAVCVLCVSLWGERATWGALVRCETESAIW